SSILFLGASLLTSGALATLNYTARMTHHGVEVPVVFTDLPPRNRLSKQAPNHKRDGPVSNTVNWAGAIQEAPVSGVFSSISATWQVPGIYSPGPALTDDTYYLYEWVGIDSDCGVILQAGTAQTLNVNGWSNFVWWEWFPSNAPQGVNIPINYQDTFTVTITATSTESGTITIENNTQGYSMTVDVSGGQALCLSNAEWVVENPVAGSLPCPNFNTVWFSNAVATTTTGAQMGIDGTTAIHMDSSDGTVIYSEWVDNNDMYV
ncbi:concanavalin A-like lectin/glucanase, partial [Stipitochalara longipes BDJ]